MHAVFCLLIIVALDNIYAEIDIWVYRGHNGCVYERAKYILTMVISFSSLKDKGHCQDVGYHNHRHGRQLK